jgi:sulfite exporter TauE/SafE
MSDWMVAAALTLAASVHCVGMCGGFILAVSGPGRTPPLALVGRQMLLQLGKATTYVFLGALAGALGAAVTRSGALAWTGRGLTVVAGVAIILAGLTLLGWHSVSDGGVARWIAPVWNRVVSPLLVSRPRGSALIVGMAMGLLPCPLIYAGLAAAVAGGSALFGASVMAGVALGTIPALALVAALGAVRPRQLGVWPVRLAGALLIAAGVFTLARGFGLLHGHHGHAPTAVASPSAPGGEHAGHAEGTQSTNEPEASASSRSH